MGTSPLASHSSYIKRKAAWRSSGLGRFACSGRRGELWSSSRVWCMAQSCCTVGSHEHSRSIPAALLHSPALPTTTSTTLLQHSILPGPVSTAPVDAPRTGLVHSSVPCARIVGALP
eukprot:scaffold2135_cov341-Prasinococcus_capsulatus_cf.AAC.13